MSISPVMQTNCKHSQSLSGTSTVAAYGADGGGGMGPLRRGDERRFLVDVAIDRRCNLRQSPTGDAISDRRCNLRQEMQSPTADAISALRQEMHSPTLSDRRLHLVAEKSPALQTRRSRAVRPAAAAALTSHLRSISDRRCDLRRSATGDAICLVRSDRPYKPE